MKIQYLILPVLFLIIGCGKESLYKKDTISESYKLKARDHFTTGMFYQLDAQYDKALIEFYEALLYDSTSYAIYNRIAENHMSLGRYESALRYLKKSLAINAHDAETYRFSADCHHRLKNDSLAIENLDKVLTLDPYDDNSRTLLILLYRKNNDQAGLAEQYEQMIRLFGFDEDWVMEASKIHLRNGQFDEALNLFTAYLEYDSTSTQIWFSAGAAYEIKNEIDTAIDYYYRAITLSPESEHIAEQIYRLCRQQGDWDKIIRLFTPFLVHDLIVYRLTVADAYLQKEQLEEARNLLQPLLSKDPVPWKTYELLGRIDMEENQLDLAANNFQTAIDLEPKNPMVWIYLGFTFTDLDSLNAAEKNYRDALKYFPNNPFILSLHGISLSRLDRDQDALIPFKKAVELDSKNVNTLVSYAITLNRLNQNEDALAVFEEILSVDSTNITALTSLGMLYDQLKMYEKCDSLYDEALKIYPDNDLLMNNFSYSLSEREIQLDYALSLAKKAVAAQPENGAYLDTIGWIYYKLGNYELALEYIKKSLDNREEGPVVIEHLGDVYLKLGYPDEAKIYWRRALQMDNDNEELKRKIESN
jgi:tetratricopeptide (TPR) repeat protein